MVLRTTAQPGRMPVHIEVTRPDELDAPVPADDVALAGVERRSNGQFATPEAATVAARKGGAVKARRVRLARSLGLQSLEQSAAFAPYRRSASAFRQYHCKELARMAGGEVSAGPCSMVASASLQLAASRFLFDQAAQSGDAATFKIASGLANDSRQNLLCAYELATREAKCRTPTPKTSDQKDVPNDQR